MTITTSAIGRCMITLLKHTKYGLRGAEHCAKSSELRVFNRHFVFRDDVAQIMKELDPEGVERRKQHRLVRRKAYSLGPNDCWCYDGHDKLKKFGIGKTLR